MLQIKFVRNVRHSLGFARLSSVFRVSFVVCESHKTAYVPDSERELGLCHECFMLKRTCLFDFVCYKEMRL